MPALQRLDAVFFRSRGGNEPVRDWLKGLPKDQRQAIGEDIAYVEFKWPIGKPHVDHLRGSVWEVRTALTNRIARTLFAVEGRHMLLLHGFIKKTRLDNLRAEGRIAASLHRNRAFHDCYIARPEPEVR